MAYDFEGLDKLAEKTLSAKRYYHTQCVVKQAWVLARIYSCDEEKAMAAGWLHDICKELKLEMQLQWLTKYGIILDSVQRSQPKTWHGMAACGFIKCELGVCAPELLDPELLDAVRYHTTARGEMTLLDEVVYLADLTSEDRTYPDVAQMRKLAMDAIGPAMKYAMRFALNDLLDRLLGISRDSLDAYNYYLKF